MKPETVFRQNKVIPFLKTLPKTAYFPISQLSISGTPDFLLCIRGYFVALELKSERGVASALQKYNLKWIHMCMGKAIVADPNNWDSVKALLTKIANGEIDD